MARTTKKSKSKKATQKSGPVQPKIQLNAEALQKLQSDKIHNAKLKSVWGIIKSSVQLIARDKRLFGGIIAIYGFLNILLIQGLVSGNNLSNFKDSLNSAFSGNISGVGSGAGNFALLLGNTSNNSSQNAGAYQTMLSIIVTLAIIWALRQVSLGKKPLIRDSYYKGMAPAIPFILVLCVVALQLIPFVIGSTIYGLVVNNGIAIHNIEKLLWLAVFIGSALLSLYMITSSLIALYIVTLPDMTPLKALRSAKELVNGRRWTVMRKIVLLPIILLCAEAIIMIPIVLISTTLAALGFFVLIVLSLLAANAYMFTLYKDLLNE